MHVKKQLLLPAFAIGALLLADCSPKTGKSTTERIAKGSDKPPYTEAQITEGKMIFTNNCGKCHKLVAPAAKSVKKWNTVLPRMIKKAKLSKEQGQLVRAFVMANVKK